MQGLGLGFLLIQSGRFLTEVISTAAWLISTMFVVMRGVYVP